MRPSSISSCLISPSWNHIPIFTLQYSPIEESVLPLERHPPCADLQLLSPGTFAPHPVHPHHQVKHHKGVGLGQHLIHLRPYAQIRGVSLLRIIVSKTKAVTFLRLYLENSQPPHSAPAPSRYLARHTTNSSPTPFHKARHPMVAFTLTYANCAMSFFNCKPRRIPTGIQEA